MDILVVEPVRADFLLVQQHLTQRDSRVRCSWAADRAGVETALAAQPWAVVLSDYTVPGIPFLDLLALLRARQPDVPVILLCGSVEEDLAVDLIKRGLSDFVLEHDLARLTPIIERSLREAGERVARRRAETTLRMLAQSLRALEVRKQQLEAVVAARTEEAERMARAKCAFLADMNHEIRTPLTSMLRMAQVGRHQDDGDHTPYTRILESGHQVLGVLDDVLDFSKLEARTIYLAAAPMDLPRVLEGAVERVGQTTRSTGVDLRLELGPGLPQWVRGDASRITQVLVNLLSNAVQLTDRGNVTLSADRVDGRTTFRVTDTGAGMTETQLARFFLPFERSEPSATRRFGGSGLGLAITRRLVEVMKGTIEVSRGSGRGSVVTVRLPLPDAHPPADTPEQRPATKDLVERPGCRLRGIRVLAAEDNVANRLLLGEMLRLEGARLTMTEDGQAAFALLEGEGHGAFDLVLTDIQMPVMDGYALARRIRSFAPTLPVIGLTAHTPGQERERCLDAGMVAQLSKPIDMKLLVSAIRQHARARPNAVATTSPPAQV